MDPGTPIGGKRRGFRRWRMAVICLLASPAILLLLVNLALSSPWSRRWMAGKIGQRTGGLEASVSSATWSPWNGLSIGGIELLQPPALRAAVKQPLLRIDAVRASPVWRSWLRGRPEISGVVIDTPRVVLPLELLSHLAASVPAAQPIPQATAPASAPPTAPTSPPAPVTPAPPAAAPAVQPAPQPPPLPQPTAFIEIRNVSLTVVSASHGRTLLDISKTSGLIPIAGGAASSSLKIGPVAFAGKQLLSGTTAKIAWSAPFLSLQPLEMEIEGHPLVIAGKIAAFSGLPLQIDARLPRRPLQELALPFGARASAQSLAAEARFRGLLLSPASWQGDLLAEALSPVVHTPEKEMRFDKATTVTVLRGGIFSCADARLIGDEISLLGNATLLADGRCAGALRFVASPETVAYGAKRLLPMLPGEPSLTPLSTPQRAAFDLEAFGNIGQLFLRLGKGGPVIELKP